MFGKNQMSIFWKILRLIKIIFLEKVMAVLVDKCQALRGQHGKPLFLKNQTPNQFWICRAPNFKS
jgi:hypothetical protein